MKKAVYGIIGIFVLVIAVVLALPFIIPAEKLKEELILAVNDATGRTLAIDGEFGVSVFPVLGLNASKVSFSNAATSSNPNMATIDKLTVALNLLPLLSGNVQVDTFILEKPVVILEVDKQGGQNWIFAASAPEKKASTAASEPSEKSSDLGIQDLNLGDVQIIEGSITYIDHQIDAKHEVSDVNLSIVLNGLDKPFKTKGSAVWNNEKLTLDTELEMLSAVLENKPTALKTSVTSSKVALTYDGQLTSTTPLSLGGKIDLNVPSLKALSAWVGQPLDARENTFGLVSVKGDIGVTGQTYSFQNAELAFDKITGQGNISANLDGKVPFLEGNLTLPVLDVNPYLPEETGENSTEKPEKKKTKAAKKEKWDDTPIDLSALKTVNAKFSLSVGEILIKKIKIGKSNLSTTLQDGLLNVGLTELNLYDGKGKGAITVNARKAKTRITQSFKLQGIQLQPFLTDAADFSKLQGTGLIQIKVKTVGNSQKSMVKALNGNGKILFENGAVNGVNLAAMARNITSAFTGGAKDQKTDFAELSGTFKIKNGVLKNKDLKMLNPFVRLSGKGKVNMPPKTLNYRVEPKLVKDAKGQGGDEASGIVVPVKISGSWDKLKFAPDLAGVITQIADPKAITKTLEKTGKGSLDSITKGGGDLGKTLEGGVKGLFGKTN